MRILEFNVDKQKLIKSKDCDFSGLVAGSVGYLRAKFYFTQPEWDQCTVKVASFWVGDKEYAVRLGKHNSCSIPDEALVGRSFRVSVIGACTGYKIKTNKTLVRQEVN